MIEQIKRLRDETSASLGEIRAALEEARGDDARAREILRERLGAIAGKKSSRDVRAGVVDAYVHANGKIGVVVELLCETDFVARSPRFKSLAHDLALHIAATAPEDTEALLEQEFVRDPSRTVSQLITEAAGTFGENIRVGNFARLAL